MVTMLYAIYISNLTNRKALFVIYSVIANSFQDKIIGLLFWVALGWQRFSTVNQYIVLAKYCTMINAKGITAIWCSITVL